MKNWSIVLLLAGVLFISGQASAAAQKSVVGVIRSDYPRLKHPAPPNSQLTDAQIEDVVRTAVRLAGGLSTAVKPDARWIAVKVNIVEVNTPGSGAITDARVVKAVVELAHEAAPQARISIVEGPGEWIAPDAPGADTLDAERADGWAAAGYRDLLKDPELQGIHLDLVDLNIDQPVLTPVPPPWYAREKYWVPRTVLECDALIDVPVMKIIQAVGMTCAMKNFVGIAPGLKYGWPKMRGVPGQGPGIPHSVQILDEAIVDFTSLAHPAFTVVDAIVGMEKAKTARADGKPVRMNTILAGADIAAVDATCARLMGLNPDDVEYLTLAARKGIGQIDEKRIRVEGQQVAQVGRRFEKTPPGNYWEEMGHYGQGNRTWLLKGPLATKDFSQEFLDPATARPRPNQDGWSPPVYFSDDRIDLGRYFERATDCVVYGYAEFTASRGGPAELWVGSDEGLAVWIDGKEVYRFAEARRHRLPNDRVPITLTAGDHRLLVKVGQSVGRFGFSLNICAPETDPRYEGNRVEGLEFRVPTAKGVEVLSMRAEDETRPSSRIKAIENAHWEENPATLVGALAGGLRAMGDSTRSAAYLMGLTGYAFRLTVSDSLAWSDPGIDRPLLDFGRALDLCRNLGYELEMVSGNEKEPNASSRIEMLWQRVMQDIDRGVPVVLFRRGWWLIRGYDVQRNAYIVSEWREDEVVHEDEIADEDTGEFALIFFGQRRPVDIPQTEMASLHFAVAHARQPDDEGGRLANGLTAYDRWIAALQNNTVADPWAHAFHTMLLHQARQSAAAYLDTLASKGIGQAAAHLRQAADSYRREAESLGTLERTFGFEPPGKPELVKDPAARAAAANLLKEALKWETAAIEELEKALAP